MHVGRLQRIYIYISNQLFVAAGATGSERFAHLLLTGIRLGHTSEQLLVTSADITRQWFSRGNPPKMVLNHVGELEKYHI